MKKDWRNTLIALLFVGVVFDVIGDASAAPPPPCVSTPMIVEQTAKGPVATKKAIICQPVSHPRFRLR